MSLPEVIKPEKVGFSSTRLTRINNLVQRYVDSQRLAGAVSLVARRGHVVHFERCGHRELESGQPMELDSIFRIYSMTKPVTTVAALMLYEDGHFQLDDPVAKYLPAFKQTKVYAGSGFAGMKLVDQAREMTIKDLMSHTAGLSYGWFKDSPVEDLYRSATLRGPDVDLAEMVERLAALPLLYQPGTAWRYSYATDVLGRLVEVLSGKSLDVFFDEYIFKPLGMEDTGFFVPENKIPRFTAVYCPVENFNFVTDITRPLPTDSTAKLLEAPTRSPFIRPPVFLSGGGGLVSTTADYFRFAQMLLNRGVLDGTRLLGPKTLELMTLNHILPALQPIGIGENMMYGYGFGLGVSVLIDVAQSGAPGSAGSFGWGGAAMTHFWVDPVEELIGIFMTQFMPSSHYPVTREFKVAVYQALID